LPGPGQLLDAATRLGELTRLGRAIRAKVLEPFGETDPTPAIFVNLHPQDLSDPELLDAGSLLGKKADRIVLEVTERASLGEIDNVRAKIGRLRELGFRIAVDDLGAGYAGLTSFALLEPEIVKLDMTLVRDIDKNPVKQKLVETMAALCRSMGLLVVAEGIETSAERDVLEGLGCDLFQGYLFARPGRAFPTACWDSELLGESASSPLPRSGTHEIVRAAGPSEASVEPERSNSESRLIPLFVLDSLGDGVILTNARGRIVYSNKAADSILGVKAAPGPPSEWGTHYGVYYPDGWQLFPIEEYPLVRALRGEDTNNVEMCIRNASVEGAIVSVTGRPLRDGNGAVVGACVVFRDITAVRHAECDLERLNAELMRTNAELRALCEQK
jgi:EAL domain-containing protein (putative c-di-GMP-specific phosphodiesterase class I)